MIRIKDIAMQAGVSPTTVSNVIHGNSKKVSPETVKKIQHLLKEMEYVPSMGARMLASNKSRVIGVLVGVAKEKVETVESNAFTNVLIRSLELEIYKKNYYMILHFSSTPEEGIQFASTWNVEGLITIGIHGKENEKLQNRCKVPVVSIDTYYEGEQVANVGLDDSQGGYLMAEYLIQTGHRRIGFLADNDVGVDHARWCGIGLACREYPDRTDTVEQILIPHNKKARVAYYKENLRKLAEAFDALFFASDYYAMEAMIYLRDLGIQVPEDISVAGFDDNENAQMCRPPLTTVHQDVKKKAIRAVGKLFAFLGQEKEIPMLEKLPVELIIRESVKERNR